jgi:hypothetical protein
MTNPPAFQHSWLALGAGALPLKAQRPPTAKAMIRMLVIGLRVRNPLGAGAVP